MLTLYTARSPAVIKVLIALEELGLDFKDVPVNISGGDQLAPEFGRVSPNRRIPALVDSEPAGGGEPFAIFESGAILLYLAEKTGRLMPTDPRGHSEAIQWIMWQMAGLGPTMGHARHFRHFSLGDQSYAIARFTNEATRLCSVLDERLRGRDHVAGDAYSMADICCWPWLLYSTSNGQRMADFPDLLRWFEAVRDRPAVRRVAERWWDGIPIEQGATLDDETRRILFNRTDDGRLRA
jgi:GSH-dependent disulfide-bond oxidoreductase